MKQHPCPEDLALHVSYDLSSEETQLIRQHLDECPACQTVAEELAAGYEWVKSSQTEPLPQDLEDVHKNVMSRVSRRRVGLDWWKWLPAPVVGCVALAILCWPVQKSHASRQHVKQVDKPFEALRTIPVATPPAVYATVLMRKSTRTNASAGLRSVALITRPGKPVAIRLTTADPNVVILLEADERTMVNE